MEAVSRAAWLTDINRRVFCSLTYAQAILNHCFGHKNDQPWYEYDVGWLPHCDELVILMLPGWNKSEGVRIEIKAAGALGIAVRRIEMSERFTGLPPAQSKKLHLRILG